MPSVPEFEIMLLRKARQDVRAAEVLADEAGCDGEIVGFHCQQAVEKAIKAVLESRRIEYPLTHDLVALLGLLGAEAVSCPLRIDDARQLDPFAVRFRYEDDTNVVSPDETFDQKGGVAIARQTVDWAGAVVEAPKGN